MNRTLTVRMSANGGRIPLGNVGTTTTRPRTGFSPHTNAIRKAGTTTLWPALTLAIWEGFNLLIRLKAIKYSTQKHYEYIVNVHLIPTLGDMQLRLITRESVQSLLTSKRRSGLSWRTVKHIHTTFGTILAAAVMEDLIPDNPVRKTKLPRRGPIAEKAPIDPQKVRALLKALPEPSRSLAWLLSFTGLRIGELLALRWCDVDLDPGFIRVRQAVYERHFDDPKSNRSRRTVPLGTQGAHILAAHKPEACDPEGLVFAARNGPPLDRRNLLNRQLKPTCKKLKLEGVTWYWLRHATATLLNSAGASLGTIQALLGHSSPEITRDVYLHSVPADARRAVQRLEELIGPKWTQVPVWPEPVTNVTQ